jgi:hypothetical protein
MLRIPLGSARPVPPWGGIPARPVPARKLVDRWRGSIRRRTARCSPRWARRERCSAVRRAADREVPVIRAAPETRRSVGAVVGPSRPSAGAELHEHGMSTASERDVAMPSRIRRSRRGRGASSIAQAGAVGISRSRSLGDRARASPIPHVPEACDPVRTAPWAEASGARRRMARPFKGRAPCGAVPGSRGPAGTQWPPRRGSRRGGSGRRRPPRPGCKTIRAVATAPEAGSPFVLPHVRTATGAPSATRRSRLAAVTFTGPPVRSAGARSERVRAFNASVQGRT